jgi:hypothetical protein
MGPVRRLRLVITADDYEAAAAVALVALIAFSCRVSFGRRRERPGQGRLEDRPSATAVPA